MTLFESAPGRKDSMTKKLVFALGCFALLVSFTSVAMADAIAFNFAPFSTSNPHGVLTAPSGGNLTLTTWLTDVTDTDTGITHSFGSPVGTTSITTGASGLWSMASNFVTFNYNQGGSVTVYDGAILLLTGIQAGGASYGSGLEVNIDGKNG